MKTQRRIAMVVLLGAVAMVTHDIKSQESCLEKRARRWPTGSVPGLAKRRRCAGPSLAGLFGQAAQDIVYSHLNLISWDSFKIIVTVFPFFISARMIDEKLQRSFHDRHHHKNVNQMPSWCETVAKYGVGFPIAFFALRGLTDPHEEWKRTCRAYVAVMPFVIFGKDIIKKFRFEACLRPWHERFDKHERASGGFPSGHVAEATYTAVLFGMRFGWRWALPLGITAATVGITFVNCNRHYLSQVVAGAGFGTLYALAVNKLIDARLTCNFEFGLSCGQRGEPQISCAYRF